MRIRRLHIDGFGCIRDREIEFDPEHASLLIAQNEQGKSTIALSILALLYGLPEEGEGDGAPALRSFQPWGGGPYRARITLECRRGLLTIERDFAHGKVKVTDAEGHDITSQFETRVGLRVGEAILGLSRQGFSKTAFVRQNEILAMKGGPEITRKLKATADSETGFVTVEEAIEVLDKFLAREGEGIDREIGERQDAVLALQKRNDELASLRRMADDLGFEVDRNFQLERELLARIRRAEYLASLAAETVVTARIDTEERRRAEVASLETEAASLKAFHDFPAGAWDDLQRLSGQLETIDREIAALQAEFEANLAGPKHELERKRAPYLGMNGMTPGNADELAAAIMRLKAAAAALLEKKGQLAAEEERIGREGAPLLKYDELAARFSKLTVDDGAFLLAFPIRWKENKASHEQKKAERDKQAAEARAIEEARGKRKRTLAMVAGVAPVVLCAIAFVLHSRPAAFYGLLGAAAVALAGVGVPLAKVGSWFRDEQDQAEGEVKRLNGEIQNVEGVLKAMEARLREVSQKAGIAKLEQAVQLFAYWKQLEGKTANARALRAERQERERALEVAQTAALVYFQRAKRQAPQVTVDACEKLLVDLRESFVLTTEMVRLSTMEAEVLSRRGGRAQARREAHANARHLLRSGGVVEEDLAVGLERFRERREKHFRRRDLVEKEIPSARSPISPDGELAGWKARQAEARSTLAAMRRDDGALAKLVVERDEASCLADYRAGTEELSRVRTERLDMLRKVGELQTEHRREAPGVRRELAEAGRALARARMLRRSAHVAVDTLREISKGIYMTWAGELNRRSTKVLGKLTPDYEGMRFRDDLTFSIFRKDLARELAQSEVDALLSTGAKDQVYLAIRLALADYFSTKGERIPLILDDPFATADDQRFLRAMEYLTGEVAGEHQVMILTCHERRHRWWLEETHAASTRHLRVIPFP